LQTPFKWDNFSDQPYQLKDKLFKKKMRKKEFYSLIQTFFTGLIMVPLSLISTPFIKRKEIVSKDFFSLGVDFQREPQLTIKLLQELEIERILIRFKLWEMDSLEELKSFILQNKKKKIILKIMQDRENIEDLKLLEINLRKIFQTLDELIDFYEIGSTINRAKWGFFSVREYNEFYKIAYNLKHKEFPTIKLMGSSVIDFEFHFTAHTLFNLDRYKYDATSALLYVDRRGAPENTQLGFNLTDKIALLSTMVWLSPKSRHSLHITETNWPISNTAPYAPTSEHECVSEKLYADYMLRYYLLTLASQQVNSLSWHQLIARGYGLVDPENNMKKRDAFFAFKYMVKTLHNAQFLRLDIKRGYYILQFLIHDNLLQIHWALKEQTLQNENYFSSYTMLGKPIKDKILSIGSSPIYIFIQENTNVKTN
jgi:hypothetical protein